MLSGANSGNWSLAGYTDHAGIDNIVPFGGPPFYIPQKGGLHRHPTGDYYVARVEKFVHVSGLSDLADLCVLCQCPALGRDMNLRRTSFHNPMGLTNTHRVLDRIEAHPSIFLRRVGLTNTQRVLDCIEAHPSIFLRRVGLTDIQRAFDRIEAHPSIFLRRVGLPQWWQQ
ncbi:hypothetical protein M752DRAFT_120528 [Aspergillus phoenicis ATCC 13157]|uniref:Uncharacterized protein n=1 Tax=Aspergillus phoenicis ATCC 13157 TaxID=1353007 RepID=A0A370PTP6_ASPPH|nr:hypothetical protein M752DRAFT_120528 [Aspergillus phoenicis ATCC 13157]